MGKKFITSSASNTDADDMFSAICKDVLNISPSEAKEMLGIPSDSELTIKDVITIIQDNQIECEIKVTYEVKEDKPKSEEKGLPF